MAVKSFFTLMRKSYAVYDKYCQKVTQDWGINSTSFQVLMFLANSPEANTARDVCIHRGLKTGIVSVSIEHLVEKGLVERRIDPQDRRIQRLYLTERAKDLVDSGNAIQLHFYNTLKAGLTEEEFNTYYELTKKIQDIIDDMDRQFK